MLRLRRQFTLAVFVLRFRRQFRLAALVLRVRRQFRLAALVLRVRRKAFIFVRKTLQILPGEIKKALAFLSSQKRTCVFR